MWQFQKVKTVSKDQKKEQKVNMEEKCYAQLSDEALVYRCQTGDGEAMDFLMEKYKPVVRMKANPMFLLGGDMDDLIQEGMIGLFKAIRDYDPNREAGFATFANLCISRQIYKAVEAASRKKHVPLNSYISLSQGEEGETMGEMQYQLEAPALHDPEKRLISQEELEQFWQKVDEVLSPLERKVLKLHLAGANYHQIAEQLGKSEKSIDNALQRMKRKIQPLKTL